MGLSLKRVFEACTLLGYNYIAKDKDERWFGFSKKPNCYDIFWDVEASAESYEMIELFCDIQGIPWQDSLYGGE